MSGRSVLYHLIDFLYSVARYGVGSLQYQYGDFYRLRSFERDRAYTRHRRDVLCQALNPPKELHVLRSKNEFNAFFKAFIGRAWMYCGEVTAADIADFIRQLGRVIVKPGASTEGRGVYALVFDPLTVADVAEKLAGTDTMIEEILVQHPDMSFASRSVNSVRVSTVIDARGEVRVVKAALRCGIGDTLVDNYTTGGAVYPVDIATGRIEGPGGNNVVGPTIYVHPGTNCFMPGRIIPFWHEAIETVSTAAAMIPNIRLVGWDVAILENGPELIEGNSKPGEMLMECPGGVNGLYRLIQALV